MATAIPFPGIKPASRSYSPGRYPQTEFRAQNGALTVLKYGNRRFDASLTLEFRNITDDNAALILANYEAVNKNWNYATFTNSTGASGASSDLARYLREVNGSGLRWRYAEPPTVENTFRGRSNVRCQFVGVLDG